MLLVWGFSDFLSIFWEKIVLSVIFLHGKDNLKPKKNHFNDSNLVFWGKVFPQFSNAPSYTGFRKVPSLYLFFIILKLVFLVIYSYSHEKQWNFYVLLKMPFLDHFHLNIEQQLKEIVTNGEDGEPFMDSVLIHMGSMYTHIGKFEGAMLMCGRRF